VPRRLARALGPIAGLTLGACTFAGPNLPITSVAPAAHRASGASTEFVGFWESWSDTNRNDAFYRLQSVPGSVTSVDVAFSIADGNEISPPQNTYPLQPGAKRVHARGGRLLLSFGGATSPFDITDPPLFAANLRTYAKAHPKLYDGFDFDDEVIPSNGPQQLVDVILAVRQAFPSAVISFDAFVDGADAQPGSGHQGEDIPVIEQAGSAIDYVNVMAYDQYGWKPPGIRTAATKRARRTIAGSTYSSSLPRSSNPAAGISPRRRSCSG
jgi:chitinase